MNLKISPSVSIGDIFHQLSACTLSMSGRKELTQYHISLNGRVSPMQQFGSASLTTNYVFLMLSWSERLFPREEAIPEFPTLIEPHSLLPLGSWNIPFSLKLQHLANPSEVIRTNKGPITRHKKVTSCDPLPHGHEIAG